MSNFSFSDSVFKRLVLQTHKNQGLFGKGLNAYGKNFKPCQPAQNALANMGGKLLQFVNFMHCLKDFSNLN